MRLDALDELDERRIPRHVRPQDQRVREKPDERLQIRRQTASGRRSNNQVRLAGVSMQQRHPGGRQHHERRRTLTAGEPLRGPHGLWAHDARQVSGRHRGRLRQRPVRGKLEKRRNTGELLPPVHQLPGNRLAADARMLIAGVLDVLQGKNRQCGGHARHTCFVERLQFPMEVANRPSIGRDVVLRDHQEVVEV